MADEPKDGVRRAAEELAGVVYVPGGVMNLETADKFEGRIARHTHAREMAEALGVLLNWCGHAHIFLTSREKMHKDGVELFDESVETARQALAKFHGTEGER